MAPASNYEIGRVPRTLVGADALDRLGAALADLGASSAVVVADPGVVATGYVDRLVAALGPLRVAVHVVPWGEPTIDSVDTAAAEVRTVAGAIVVGVGGGSALDIAKQAAVVSTGDDGVEPLLLCANPLPGRRPIVAVPTTSGTGAEATRTCIVSDRRGRKVWTWGDEMLPDLVVLDPTAAASMPRPVTIGTGLDALVHAVEACSGRRRSSIAAAAAQRSIALIVDALPRAVADGADLAARQAMQEAAFLAGVAIDNCGTGVAHSIGHALGTLYHVPHGVSVAVGLDAALRWNVDGERLAYADVAAAWNCAEEAVPDAYRDVCSSVDLAAAVAPLDVQFDPESVAATMIAVENQPMLQNNARHVDDDDRMMLAEATCAVWQRLRP